MPHLKGLTRVEADKRLRQFGLELGETRPDDAADNFVVRSQIPAEDLRVDKRHLGPRVPREAQEEGGEEEGGGQGRRRRRRGAARRRRGRWRRRRWRRRAASVTVPAFTGKNVAAYTAALSDRGLKAKVSRSIAATPENTVLSVKPKVGAKAKRGAA